MVATELEEWGELGQLPSVEAIQERINTRFDKLFHYDKDGGRHAHVCCVCKKFIAHMDDLTWFSIDELKKNQYLLDWDKVSLDSSSIPSAL
jgi:hypothetical protein